MRFDVDYNQAPLLVIWETTRACALACRHCRADAIDKRDPRELSTEEGYALLDDVAKMGTPLIIFTGGDPLQRDDLEDLIVHAKSLNLRAGAIPAATDRLTRERVRSMKEAGLDQMAMSLDGPTAEKHDNFRRVEGSFAKVIEGAEWARQEGLAFQVNTVFAAWNMDDFEDIAELVEKLGTVFWEVFFLVPTGRGTLMESCTADQFEVLFDKLYTLSKTAPFIIKVTEAQHYRRFVMQHEAKTGVSASGHPGHPGGHPGGHPQAKGKGAPIRSAPVPVNAGKGFLFVDHVGDVYPSGFLPITAGNVRDTSIIEIYRNHPLFLELRNPDLLKGRCGACEFRDACGGSRSRAYAVTGDYLAEESFCNYVPGSSFY